jgi:predicted O-methyltransferase YrrM
MTGFLGELMIDEDFLIKIFNECGSDKSHSHNYERGYSQILPESVNNMLEIGIANHSKDQSSLLAWEKLYPNASIYAIDIDESKLINERNIKSFIVNQFDREALNQFSKNLNIEFDLVIDDGVHLLMPTIDTFEAIFPLISKDGVYCIEDVRKNLPAWAEGHQMVEALSEYFDSRSDVSYEIFDTRPGVDDDSIIFSIKRFNS